MTGPRKLTESQIREAAALHATGLPINHVCKRYGVSNTNLSLWLRRYGFHVDSIREATARRRYPCNDHFFGHINTEEKAYWAGFITADGCITNNRNSPVLSVSVARPDKEHLALFLSALSARNPICDCRNQSYVCLYSHALCADLTRQGIGPRKTSRERIPTITKALRRHFIRGYFDGDGWCSLGHRPGWEALGFCGGLKILEQIREWICQNVPEAGHPKIAAAPGMYRLCYTGGLQVRAIARALYKSHTIALKRKCDVADALFTRARTRRMR